MSESHASGKRAREEDGVGNLGWLASSGVLPRKKIEIEGVSGGSILELQAQLFRAQEHAKLRASGLDVPDRRTAGLNVAALMKRQNAGVEERDRKDRVEVKVEAFAQCLTVAGARRSNPVSPTPPFLQSAADRVGECYAALERKAQLYEKLARGEVDDDGEQYEVDFLRKGGDDDDDHGLSGLGASGREPLDTMLQAVSGTGGMVSADMQRERERRAWEQEQQQVLADEEAQARRRKQKEELLSLGEQTREERQRAEAVKARKEELARTRRDDLKQKFLRDQLAKKLAQGGKGGPGAAPAKKLS